MSSLNFFCGSRQINLCSPQSPFHIFFINGYIPLSKDSSQNSLISSEELMIALELSLLFIFSLSMDIYHCQRILHKTV